MSWDVLLHLTGDYLTLTVHLRTEGQEIYKGENSGIEHWNTALNKGNKDWKVVCPDKLKHVFAGQNVMETKDAAALDLTVSLRTYLAGDVSSFTNSLIDGDIQRARTFVNPIYKAGFSMFITRDLQARKIKRVKSVSVRSAVIYRNVESQTGYSDWDFSVDFDNWGHVTGTYWTQTDNDDSSIPHHYGQMVSGWIHDFYRDRENSF